MKNNKFIRIYNVDKNEPVPFFTFSELEYLQNDETLNPAERSEFKKIFNKAKFSIENNQTSIERICAFVRPESGVLALLITEESLVIQNDNVVQLSYEDLKEEIRNSIFPQLKNYYRKILLEAYKTVQNLGVTFDRMLFLKNKYTNRITTWVD